ncbi:MAG: hypothetical protein ACK53Y_16670 [bacterium]
MEKSSKNYISVFRKMPARGLPKPPPTSPCQESAEFKRGGARTRYADAKSSRGIGTRREGGEEIAKNDATRSRINFSQAYSA